MAKRKRKKVEVNPYIFLLIIIVIIAILGWPVICNPQVASTNSSICNSVRNLFSDTDEKPSDIKKTELD